MVAVERRPISERPLSRAEFNLNAKILRYDIAYALIKNPGFARQAAIDFVGGRSPEESRATWSASRGTLYEVVRTRTKSKFGKTKAVTFTVEASRPSGSKDAVTISEKSKGKNKGMHVETAIEGEGRYEDSELALLKARVVLSDLLYSF